MNSAKNKLAEGRALLAVNPLGVALPVVDAIGRHGADVLFIDCERTAVSVEGAYAMARAAKAAGVTPVIRSHSRETADLVRYFDCGAEGIILPQVETPEEAANLVAVARYATRGKEAEQLLIAQIETVGAVARLDAILDTPGIDLFLVGPNDLAHSMGFLGDTSRPEVVKAVDETTARIRARGLRFGLPVTAASAAGWRAKGAQFLFTTVEQLIGTGIAAVRKDAP